MSRKILITGCKGQLGTDLVGSIGRDNDVIGIDIDDVDLRDFTLVESFIQAKEPDIIIHAAAYTDVDGCESNRERAMAVNAGGTENIARVCRLIGAKLIYYSTDYVFDGKKGSPYREEDVPNPQTIYGRSKFEGEERIRNILDDFIILRIAWVYGAHGNNFVKTMIKLGKEQIARKQQGLLISPLRVVNDQIGTPTWTMEIVKQTRIAIENNLVGLFHSTAEGATSWYSFAQAVFDELSMRVELMPCTTEEYPHMAPRPKYSVLENHRLKKLGLNKMDDFRASLRQFLSENETLPGL
ncbi:MAG: dTDP-4-dehydrorhamnose reductase [candidate division Zixibacteria bacterium]|nr:dTDP-4-dehydrorhamnose reductase [candidate division Zixibacteria bacterium]